MIKNTSFNFLFCSAVYFPSSFCLQGCIWSKINMIFLIFIFSLLRIDIKSFKIVSFKVCLFCLFPSLRFPALWMHLAKYKCDICYPRIEFGINQNYNFKYFSIFEDLQVLLITLKSKLTTEKLEIGTKNGLYEEKKLFKSFVHAKKLISEIKSSLFDQQTNIKFKKEKERKTCSN